MLRLLSALAVAVLCLPLGLSTPVRAQSLVDGQFDAAIPTLEQVVGHRTGAQVSSPEEAVRYMQALEAAAPDRVRLVEYARSWEGRPLIYAVVTSAANMRRIDAVQADLAALRDTVFTQAVSERLKYVTLGVLFVNIGVSISMKPASSK